jgi:hypothetical protein
VAEGGPEQGRGERSGEQARAVGAVVVLLASFVLVIVIVVVVVVIIAFVVVVVVAGLGLLAPLVGDDPAELAPPTRKRERERGEGGKRRKREGCVR